MNPKIKHQTKKIKKRKDKKNRKKNKKKNKEKMLKNSIFLNLFQIIIFFLGSTQAQANHHQVNLQVDHHQAKIIKIYK